MEIKPLEDNGKVKRLCEGELFHPAKALGSTEKCFTGAVLIIKVGQCYRFVPENKDWAITLRFKQRPNIKRKTQK